LFEVDKGGEHALRGRSQVQVEREQMQTTMRISQRVEQDATSMAPHFTSLSE